MKASRLLEKLRMRLEAEEVEMHNGCPRQWDYLELACYARLGRGTDDVPEGVRWLCYIVPGDSEGYYLHIDILEMVTGKVEGFILGKFFGMKEGRVRELGVITRAFDYSRPKTCILYEGE